MEHVADVLLRRRLVLGNPAAVDPTALEQQRELAVAQLLAHRCPRLGRGQDLLGAQAGVGLLVIGHDLARGRAVADPLARRVLELAAVGPQERYEGVVRRAVGSGRAGVQRIRDDVRLLGVLDRGRRVEDALHIGGLPVRWQPRLLQVVVAVVQPAHVEAVGDRPDLALVGHAALDRVRVLAPIGPLSNVAIERLDVARVRELADRAAAEMKDVGDVVAIEAQQELGVVDVVADLLEFDLDVDAVRLRRGRGLLDVLGLEARLVRVGHGHGAGGRCPAGSRSAGPGRAAGWCR